MSEESGVTVTVREIYDSLNQLTKEVSSLGNRFDTLETEIKKQNEQADEAKERSYEAIKVANEARNTAGESKEDAAEALKKAQAVEKKRYEDKIAENENAKETRSRFYISIASALVPWVLLIALGIIYFARTGGF